MNKPRICAVVPAKGYSRRIPKKNLATVCGHPLIAWSIVQMLCSKWIDSVWVPTDSQEVAEVVRRYGGIPMKRPHEDPDATGGVPMKWAIERLMEIGEYDLVVTMLATSPLRLPHDTDTLVEKYLAHGDYGTIMLTTAELNECVLWARDDHIRAHGFLGDKRSNFMTQGGTIAISTLQGYIDSVNAGPSTDAENDNNMSGEIVGTPGPNRYYYELEAWQTLDVDYEHERVTCELLMEQFILKGRGMNVYFDYAKEHKGEDYAMGIVHGTKARTPGDGDGPADIWPGCEESRI